MHLKSTVEEGKQTEEKWTDNIKWTRKQNAKTQALAQDGERWNTLVYSSSRLGHENFSGSSGCKTAKWIGKQNAKTQALEQDGKRYAGVQLV
ncbi:hypothetical protein PoB_006717200 [Plakobranchus ocellatus]|uniref:Uncharacterized protein n=1 Tax=Plakobranchus ocellatus TaxID=259542 RepID=A0AAV4D8U5_9GAST|nr:hypothetical protein PoB_006717200 [Plakobranchus ocellatus]